MNIAINIGSAIAGESSPCRSSIARPSEKLAAHPREIALVRSAQSGDPEAFREIVEFYQGTVYAFCFRWLRSPEDAQEVCQDAFVRAYGALSGYAHRGKLSTWLYQIALNLCRDRARSPRFSWSKTVPLEFCQDIASGARAPDDAAVWNGDLKRLDQGLEALPRRLREPLILCGIEGLSHDEASAVLNCSPRAIEGRVYRARQRLAKWWENHR
ncbi:MAG: RNA polymerase sigma factor [Verrucomicrobiae bacterium]|nr:RNA polymerase sigma factor [Verrucomicrobiae bacterium]